MSSSTFHHQGGCLGARAGAHRRHGEALPERVVHDREHHVHVGVAHPGPHGPGQRDAGVQRGGGWRQGRVDGGAGGAGAGGPDSSGLRAPRPCCVRRRDPDARGLRSRASQGANAVDRAAAGRPGGEGQGHARCAWDDEQEAEARRQRRCDGSHRDPRDSADRGHAGVTGTAGDVRHRRPHRRRRPLRAQPLAGVATK